MGAVPGRSSWWARSAWNDRERGLGPVVELGGLVDERGAVLVVVAGPGDLAQRAGQERGEACKGLSSRLAAKGPMRRHARGYRRRDVAGFTHLQRRGGHLLVMALVWKVLLVLALTLPAGAYAVGQAVGPPAAPAPASVADERGTGDDGAREEPRPNPTPARPVAPVDDEQTSGESGEPDRDREAEARDEERDRSERPESEDGEDDEPDTDAESESDDDAEPDEDTADAESDEDADDAESEESDDSVSEDVDTEDDAAESGDTVEESDDVTDSDDAADEQPTAE